MTAYEEHLVNNGWSPEEAAVMYQQFSDPTFGRDPEMMREYQPGFLSIPRRAQIGEARPVTLAPAYTQRLMQASPAPVRTSPIIASTPTPVVRTRNIRGTAKKPARVIASAFTPKAPVQAIPQEIAQATESETPLTNNYFTFGGVQPGITTMSGLPLQPRPDPYALATALFNNDTKTPTPSPSSGSQTNLTNNSNTRINRDNEMGTGIQTQTATPASSAIEDENIAIPDYSLGSTNPNQLGDTLLAQKRAKDYLAWSENPALDYAYPPLELNQQALTDAAEDVKAITDYDAAQEWLALTAPSLIGMGVTMPILRGITALPRARQALMAARIARQKARGEAAIEAARKASQLQADKLVKMGEEINNNHVLGSLKNLRRYIQNGDELAKVAVESNPNTPSGIVHLSKVAGKLNRVKQSAKSRYTSAKKNVQNAYKKAKTAPKNFLEQTKPTDIPITETTLPPVNPPTATLAEKLNSYEQALADTFLNTAKSWWRGWR